MVETLLYTLVYWQVPCVRYLNQRDRMGSGSQYESRSLILRSNCAYYNHLKIPNMILARRSWWKLQSCSRQYVHSLRLFVSNPSPFHLGGVSSTARRGFLNPSLSYHQHTL